MKILVTGGAGFIGSHVAEHAIAGGHRVAVVDDLSSGSESNVPRGAEFVRMDIRDKDAVLGLFDRWRPEIVSHHAALASVSQSLRDPQRDAEINVVGGLNVLEAARRNGTRRFIFASTGGAMYEDVAPATRASVDRPPAPESIYAVHKLAFEQHLEIYRRLYGLQCQILRYSNVYGPRQDGRGEAGVIAIFIGQLLRGDALRLFGRKSAGDGGCVRDYVYVGDVARANLAAAEGRLSGSTLHVATGRGTTTLEIARKLEKIIGRPATIVDHPPRAGDIPHSVLDPGSLEAQLGPFTGFDEGLAETGRWYREASSRGKREDSQVVRDPA